MCLVILVLVAGAACAAEPLRQAKKPCAQWDTQFQQRLTPDTLPTLLTRILAAHQGHGFASTFTEEKYIPALRRPLRSSGQLVFIPRHGLYRRLQTPFVQELLMTSEALHQRQAHGATEVLPLDNLPMAKVFVEAFLALFSGSWETLQAHFQVYFRAQDNHWHLGLKPIHKAMAQVIACLILEGEQECLRHLWVQETHGDVTHDHFMAPRLLAAEQWAAYRSQFEGCDQRSLVGPFLSL
jgi:hypothetical protein